MASVTDWLKKLAGGGKTMIDAASGKPTSSFSTDAPNRTGSYGQQSYVNYMAEIPTAENNYTTGAYGGARPVGALGVAADPEAQQKQAAKDDIRNKFGTLQQVFNSLFGEIDNLSRDQASKLDQNYGTQQDDLIKSFGKYNDQTNQQFAARGAFDSSYRGGALDEGNQIFNKELTNLGMDRENKLAEIGKYAAGQKANLSAKQNEFGQYINNLDQYGLSDLLGLQSGLQSGIASGQQQAAGLGTNSEFIQGLQQIAPIQQQGTAQLAAKLQNLITSSAPTQAKRYIAQGLIKASTLNDANAQGYWNTYFDDLLRGGGVA